MQKINLDGILGNVSTVESNKPWCRFLSLLGVDVLLVTLSWAALFAALFRVAYITWEPMLLMCCSAWCYTLWTRVLRLGTAEGDKRKRLYYEAFKCVLLLLMLSALGCTYWLLFFCVGRCYILYITISILFVLMASVPGLKKFPYYRQFFLSAALVFTCATPAYYFSFPYSFLRMLSSLYLWEVICLFWVFNVVRVHLKEVNSTEYRNIRAQVILIGVYVFSFLSCLSHAVTDYDFRFSSIICLTSIILYVCISLMRKFARLSLCFESRFAVLLPALIGLLLYAPQIWFA